MTIRRSAQISSTADRGSSCSCVAGDADCAETPRGQYLLIRMMIELLGHPPAQFDRFPQQWPMSGRPGRSETVRVGSVPTASA